MAQPPPTHGEFSYQNVEIFRKEGSTLGIGSYGAVYRAKCDELPCAAKCLHEVFFQFNDPGTVDAARKFEEECHFLSTIKHPHIVQYLGTIQDPNSGRPVLLMELMDESLTRFLKRHTGPLPYHVQLNLTQDITLAIAYLHSNGIIHRDLSSNNVLLIAGSRAKVTDFGMSKLIDVNSYMSRFTLCPGTLVYMPPEALRSVARYTVKLDCFSDGVLMIQIVTRNFPNPGQNMRVVEDPRSPTGEIDIPVPEVERRRNEINLIDPTHPLLPVALDCLKDRESERPSAKEICYRIAALKEDPQYAKSVHSEEAKKGQQSESTKEEQAIDTTGIEQQQEQIQELQQQIQQRDEQIQQKDQQLDRKCQELEEKEAVIDLGRREIQGLQQKLTHAHERQQELQEVKQEKENAVTTRVQEVQELSKHCLDKSQLIEAKENQLHKMNKQLREKDKMIEDRERNLQQLKEKILVSDREVTELKQYKLESLRIITELEEKLAAKDSGHHALQTKERRSRSSSITKSIKLFWQEECQNAPNAIYRGAVTVEGSMGYFRPGALSNKQVYAYNSNEEEWSQLPSCPHDSFGLAVVKGLVTTIGGRDSAYKATNALLCLSGQGRDRKWTSHFPPMPTKRLNTAVVCDGKSLIVAGGHTGSERLSTVEVLDIESLQWYTAASLPFPFSCATATICDGNVYLLGGDNQNGKTKLVLTCSLSALLQSCDKAQMLVIHSVWRQVADVPAYWCSCATLQGELVAVGGFESDIKHTTDAIYMYNPLLEAWQVIGHMQMARSQCLVGVFRDNKLLIAGGAMEGVSTETDMVEIATVVDLFLTLQ